MNCRSLKDILSISTLVTVLWVNMTAGYAQSAAEESYDRAYFEPFNPQTARDIVDRIPGFSFDAGDNVRGFGGGAGNVLIDGARPSSKSGGVEDALRRIPANDVERVDVIRGAAGSSEAAGQSVVANIIRAGRKRSASWKLEVEHNSAGVVYPRAEGTLSARFGEWSTSLKLNGLWEQFELVGRRDRFDETGALTVAQSEDRPSVLTQGFASGEASRPLAGGTLMLNGRFGYSGFFPVTDRFQFDGRQPDGAPDGRVYIDTDSVRWTAEVGADWTRSVGNDWTFKALTLTTVRPLNAETVVRAERPVNVFDSGSRFTDKQLPVESILRSTLSRGGERRWKPEFGLEAAYNRLDSEFSFVTIDATGAQAPVTLPAADVVVEEFRGEAFTNLIWAASSKWTLETGLAAEASKISVSGDADNEQDFFFLKPSINVIYRPSATLQFQLGARRSVGQLSFGDFAASAEADVDRQFGGNPDLGPDQTWRASFAVDWRKDSLGAVNVETFHEWRNDVLEQIILPSGAFGLGNAGDGRVWGVTSSASLKLSPIIPGGLFEVRATLQDSTFDDPITGSTRSLDGIASSEASIDFRQDIASRKFSWGVNVRTSETTPQFFGDETSLFIEGTQVTVFAETTRWLGVKSRLSLRGVGGRTISGERSFFTPDRSGVFTGSEIADRTRGMFITLTIEDQI